MPAHQHRHTPAFTLPIAVLAAGWWMRVLALLPALGLLWLAILWALAD